MREFVVGDHVMLRVRPERFSPGTSKELHARRVGPYRVLWWIGTNAYYTNHKSLELTRLTWGLDSISCSCRLPDHHSWSIICSCGLLQYFSICPSPSPPQRRHQIDDVEDESIGLDSRCQHYLVRWRERPDSDYTWVQSFSNSTWTCLRSTIIVIHQRRMFLIREGLMGIQPGLGRHIRVGVLELDLIFHAYFISWEYACVVDKWT